MADESGTTQVTVDTSTGNPVDLDADRDLSEQHLVESHWRTGRWLRMVVHAQRDARAGFKDRPIGVMLTPSLARRVVDQQNAVNSPFPWGSYPGDPSDPSNEPQLAYEPDPDPGI